jgi:cell migration-inducing and hyaluronan-binding protein
MTSINTLRRGSSAVLGLLAFTTSLLAAPLRWSDPATWQQPGFRVATCNDLSCPCVPEVPIAGKNVTIPEGAEVLLDVDTPVLAGLMVHGKLIFEDKPGVGLDTEWLMVMGPGSELRIGTESAKHQSKTHITFHGTDRLLNRFGTPPLHSGNKFLMAMDGGKLSLHGASATKLSWTVIDADANPGDTSVLLATEPTGWTVGDQLALAPSGYIPTEAEKLTITAIEGRRVSFTPALQYRHFGRVQTIAGRTLDMRAEIGLLTRNIVLRGADDSLAQHFGGHVMIMGGGFATIEGAEFTRMGQRGKQGRYSLHWHWFTKSSGQPATGQYVRNSSFHDAFQRAVNIHKTNGVRVLNNVAYNIGNHAYVTAEDGDEELNVFEDNLGILTRSPAVEHVAFPSGEVQVPSLQNEHRAAVFWGKNPNNTLRRNRAVGGENGFFFDGEFMGSSEDNPNALPHNSVRTADAIFEDNVAHSNADHLPPFEPNIFYPFFTKGHGIFFRDFSNVNSGDIVMKRFFAYKNGTSSAWLEDKNQIISDSIMADMPIGVTSDGGPGAVFDSLIVGRTGNDVNGHPHNFVGIFAREGLNPGFRVTGNTFVNTFSGALFMQKAGGLTEQTLIRDNRVINGLPMGNASSFVGRLYDRDGSLSGTGVPTYLSRHGYSPDSVPHPHGSFYLTRYNAAVPSGPFFQLDSPRPNQLMAYDSLNGRIELLYRYANWDFKIPGYYLRTFVDGREVPGGSYNGTPIEGIINREIPNTNEEGAITTHTLRMGLYYYDTPVRVVERTFRFSRKEHIEIIAPAAGSTHSEPVVVKFDHTQLFNTRGVKIPILRGTVSLRLFINGVDNGPIITMGDIKLDRLQPGTHTVQIVARRTDTNAILAQGSRTFTTTYTPAPLPEGGSTPPEINWLDPLPIDVYSVRDSVPLRFAAYDAEGFVSRVELQLNGTLQRALVAAPYAHTLTGLDPGTYSVRGSAVDGDGLRTDTATRQFRVIFPPMPSDAGTPVLRVNPPEGLLFNETTVRHTLPSGALNGLTHFTASAWVRREAGTHEDALIISKAESASLIAFTQFLLRMVEGRGLATALRVGGNSLVAVNRDATVPVGVWTHVASTYDGTELALWLNGTKVASAAGTGTPVFTSAVPFAVGNHPEGLASIPFRGAIRDVRFHTTVLNADQMRVAAFGDHYSLWRALRFSEADVDNPAISGPLAAPMGDGLPNELKFALGYAPTQYVNRPLAPSRAADGTLFVEFQRNRNLPEAQRAQIEISTNLSTWTPLPAEADVIVDEIDNDLENVYIVPPANMGPRWFIRLRVP